MTDDAGCKIAGLARLPVLEGLPPGDVEALARLGTRREPSDGQVLQTRGDPVAHVFLVLAGSLVVGVTNARGERHIVFPLGAGEFLNLLPAFDRGEAIHDAQAGSRCVVLQVEIAAFRRLVHEHPALREALLKVVYRRARLVYAELAEVALTPLRQRCAGLLRQLAQAQRAAEPGHPGAALRISQAEIAEMLGFTRPIVNRELRRLSDEGVVELGYRCVRILQPDALLRVELGPDPG
jgi:CRP-like cAMP-binding protein